MSSVLGLQLQVALATLERLGVSIEPAARGLSFRRAEDLKGRRWVPWEEVATFVNRLPPEVDEQARVFAAEFSRANPLIQVLGRLTMDLRVFWELYATGSKSIANPLESATRASPRIWEPTSSTSTWAARPVK